MKVLLGTTNPSKVKRFSKLLENCDIEFITLKDLEIEDEPDETGRYFVEGSDSESKENIIYGEYEKRIVGFLKEALGIK